MQVALAAAGDVSSDAQLLQTYQEERHPAGEDAIKLSGGLRSTGGHCELVREHFGEISHSAVALALGSVWLEPFAPVTHVNTSICSLPPLPACQAGTLLRANTVRGALPRFLRRLALSVLTRLPMVRSRLVPQITEDAVTYTSSSLARPAATTAAAAAQCAGTAFPDASITLDGSVRPATDLLRGGEGCCGTLVVLGTLGSSVVSPGVSEAQGGLQDAGSAAAAAAAWPTHWGHWPLHVVSLRQQQSKQGSVGGSGSSGAVDTWGLVSKHVGGAGGVLVRPDGIIAAAGGPQEIRGWLQAHVCAG